MLFVHSLHPNSDNGSFRKDLFLLCLSGLCAAYEQARNDKKPNILVFYLDDTGIGDLEPYGQ